MTRVEAQRFWCSSCGAVVSLPHGPEVVSIPTVTPAPWCRHRDPSFEISAARMKPLPAWHPLAKTERSCCLMATTQNTEPTATVELTAKELQTVMAAMAGNHPPGLREYRLPALRKLARASRDVEGDA